MKDQRQSSSRRFFAGGLEGQGIRIGYTKLPLLIDSENSEERPKGLIAELLTLLFELLGIPCTQIYWSAILSSNLLAAAESDRFDVIVAPWSPPLRAVSHFIPFAVPLTVEVAMAPCSGRFTIGLTLPRDDPEWAMFLEAMMPQIIASGMPGVEEILERHAETIVLYQQQETETKKRG